MANATNERCSNLPVICGVEAVFLVLALRPKHDDGEIDLPERTVFRRSQSREGSTHPRNRRILSASDFLYSLVGHPDRINSLHRRDIPMESIPKSILAGRILMTMATLIYGVLPPFVDLTETHVFHPEWTPHARMHMVWLLGTNSAIAVLALYFLWLHKANSAFGVRLAGILGLCVFGGFWLSASTASLYGGALSDKDGVPPILGMDANIVVFSLALLLLLVGWFLARARSA